MSDGQGCQCGAHGECECGCRGIDWRSEREVQLEGFLDRLIDTSVHPVDGCIIEEAKRLQESRNFTLSEGGC